MKPAETTMQCITEVRDEKEVHHSHRNEILLWIGSVQDRKEIEMREGTGKFV